MPTLITFGLLGLIAARQAAPCSACWPGPGGVASQQARRFFATAPWSADAVGLVVMRTGWLVPVAAGQVTAADETMFRRADRKVPAEYWGDNRSA